MTGVDEGVTDGEAVADAGGAERAGELGPGALMAAATLIALPPLILASIVQRWLVSGLTLGAVKG